MAKPVVLQLRSYPEWDQGPLDTAFDMRNLDAAADPEALLTQIGSEVRAIASRGALRVSREMIEACPNLELIAVYGVGYDGVDLEACRDHGVRVTNTPDVLTGDVADLGMGMMLALSRKIGAADTWVRNGNWAQDGAFELTRRVHGSRAGILGFGRIGQALARRLAGFDIDVFYCDINAVPAGSDHTFIADPIELAAQVDTLFVTLSASKETEGIVGADVIEALGKGGIVVNISRASTIDEAVLLDALEAGKILGAALDVFDGEPRINPRFKTLQNVLLQPHHASGTIETRKAMGQLMRDNLGAHFAGKPLLTPVL